VRRARLVHADVEVRLPRAPRERCRELVRPLAVRLAVARGVGEDHLRLEGQDLAILQRVGRERERTDCSRATVRADLELRLAADDARPHDPAGRGVHRARGRPSAARGNVTSLNRARRRRSEQRHGECQHRARRPCHGLDMPTRHVAGGSGTTWHERLTTHLSPITSVRAGTGAACIPPAGRRAPSRPPPARPSAPATTALGCWATRGVGSTDARYAKRMFRAPRSISVISDSRDALNDLVPALIRLGDTTAPYERRPTGGWPHRRDMPTRPARPVQGGDGTNRSRRPVSPAVRP
jgi:hypothetical protein